jgi:hypothetical protein
MEGPCIFFACLVAATLGILIALYAAVRDAKPHHHDVPYRGVRFWKMRLFVLDSCAFRQLRHVGRNPPRFVHQFGVGHACD